MSANLGDIEEASLPELERLVCDAYLAGLSEIGVSEDPPGDAHKRVTASRHEWST